MRQAIKIFQKLLVISLMIVGPHSQTEIPFLGPALLPILFFADDPQVLKSLSD